LLQKHSKHNNALAHGRHARNENLVKPAPQPLSESHTKSSTGAWLTPQAVFKQLLPSTCSATTSDDNISYD
jgi:hypothetical protein